VCATHRSVHVETGNGSEARRLLTEKAAFSFIHNLSSGADGKLVVAGRSPVFPACSCRWARTHVHTRSAGNHAHSALCSPQLGPVRPDDGGTANSGWDVLLANPFRTRTAPLSSIARGRSAATANLSGSRTPAVCSRSAERPGASRTPRTQRGRRKNHEATQDHSLRR
jgi:hypothetical protein